MVSRDREHGPAEPFQERGRALVLIGEAPMGQVAARDDELRLGPLDQPRQRLSDLRGLAGAEVEVGDVENARNHRDFRL